tara:strand:+ start:475 stop:927 length:453 start_codon:yes stop_codon:yes gene_type:complete
MSVDVILTPSEIMMAAQAGIMRQVENIKTKAEPYYGASDVADWQLHIEGCLGEFALAKYLNLWWGGKGDKRNADVFIYDVRTRSSHNYDLILHPDDPDDRNFWLVTGRNGKYKIHGWIIARDGKQEKYWKEPVKNRAAFFVPQSALNSAQ